MSRFERLSALDCAFLYAESPTAHMHVGSLLFFEDNGIGERDIFEHIQSRLHYVPRFRKKVRFVPGGFIVRCGWTIRTSICAFTFAGRVCPSRAVSTKRWR